MLSAPYTLAAGQSIHLSVTGLQPGESLDVTVHSTPVQVGEVTTDASGGASLQVTIPDLTPGSHEVVFTNAVSGDVMDSVPFTLTAASDTPLASTGTDVGHLVGVSLGLFSLGSGLLLAIRRRIPSGRHLL